MINGILVISPWLLTTQTLATNTEHTHNKGHNMFLKAINNVLMITGILVLSPWLVTTQTIAINTEQTHNMGHIMFLKAINNERAHDKWLHIGSISLAIIYTNHSDQHGTDT